MQRYVFKNMPHIKNASKMLEHNPGVISPHQNMKISYLFRQNTTRVLAAVFFVYCVTVFTAVIFAKLNSPTCNCNDTVVNWFIDSGAGIFFQILAHSVFKM
jgi:hypothetical protein